MGALKASKNPLLEPVCLSEMVFDWKTQTWMDRRGDLRRRERGGSINHMSQWSLNAIELLEFSGNHIREVIPDDPAQ